MQTLWISPLILKSEVYETAEAAHVHQPHEHAIGAPEHKHSAETWGPKNGWQRTLFTFGGNLVVAIGFALLLTAFYNLLEPTKVSQGVLWGIAGYAIFCLAPAAGLPPELPGTQATELTSRQVWWGATALATATGLTALVFGKHWFWRVVAVILIAAPHIVGAPQPAEDQALIPDHLQTQFRVASLLVNVAFWVALGGLSSWLFLKGKSVVGAKNTLELLYERES
jgi:cobalt transporter subunit CbtA